MPSTIAALFLAHVLADFLLQTKAMAEGKRHPGRLALHGLIVLATAGLATGSTSPWLLALAGAHLAIDLCKSFAPRGILAFLADQAAHGATILLLSPLIPMAWPDPAPALMALAAGTLLATRAGGYAVGLLMEPFAEGVPVGLTGAGRAIGNLERGLIFLLVLSGQTQNIGFLIAAKSVLRFGTVSDDRKVSEYVIVGTLASVSWALLATLMTVTLMAQLPALGIPDLLP